MAIHDYDHLLESADAAAREPMTIRQEAIAALAAGYGRIITPGARRCANCGSTDRVERDATDALACWGCYVPDITQDRYQGATEDFTVAPPNAKRVGAYVDCPCGQNVATCRETGCDE